MNVRKSCTRDANQQVLPRFGKGSKSNRAEGTNDERGCEKLEEEAPPSVFLGSFGLGTSASFERANCKVRISFVFGPSGRSRGLNGRLKISQKGHDLRVISRESILEVVHTLVLTIHTKVHLGHLGLKVLKITG